MRLALVYIALFRIALARWHGDQRDRHLAAVERYVGRLKLE